MASTRCRQTLAAGGEVTDADLADLTDPEALAELAANEKMAEAEAGE